MMSSEGRTTKYRSASRCLTQQSTAAVLLQPKRVFIAGQGVSPTTSVEYSKFTGVRELDLYDAAIEDAEEDVSQTKR